jgi:hypothetical protein
MPVTSTDPRGAWYAWRSRSSQRDDPLANYEYGVRIGQRVAIERTASWAGLVPLLQDVLDYLIETAIERDMGGGADLTGVDGSDQAVCPEPADVVPDPTVGSSAAQVGR